MDVPLPTVLITGGTKGIGKAIAERLFREGYNLVLTYAHDHSRAEKTKEELELQAEGASIRLLKADISNMEDVGRIVRYIERESITLRGIIFNAGLTDRSAFGNIDEKEWNKVFTANVHFPVFLLQQLYNSIEPNGSVIFTGSLMGITPHSVSLSYGVTKAAVHALIKNLVKFFAEKKVRVNGIAPGFVMTQWQKEKPKEIVDSICEKVALGRFCEPNELTDAYLMLLQNNYINGEVIVIDGGYSYK